MTGIIDQAITETIVTENTAHEITPVQLEEAERIIHGRIAHEDAIKKEEKGAVADNMDHR